MHKNEINEELTKEQIGIILPQAYPFLLIDRIVNLKYGESLLAIKNITANEWPFFAPNYESDFYPETLLIEAAAQASIVLYIVSKMPGKQQYVLGKIKADFEAHVGIGEQLQICVKAGHMLKNGGYSNIILTNSQTVGKIEIFYSIR